MLLQKGVQKRPFVGQREEDVKSFRGIQGDAKTPGRMVLRHPALESY